VVYSVANEGSRLEIPEGPLGRLIAGNVAMYDTDICFFFCDLSGDHINGKLQLTLNWLASIMPMLQLSG
jgi:hypothetical protein